MLVYYKTITIGLPSSQYVLWQRQGLKIEFIREMTDFFARFFAEQSGSQMISRSKRGHFQTMPMVVTASLSLLLTMELLYGYRNSMPVTDQIVVPTALQHASDIASAEDASGIFGQLFGALTPVPLPVAAPPTSPTASPPPPMPRFVLTGVLSGANAMAVMLDPSGREQAYRVGEILPGGARLEAVMENAVQIGLGGASQIIRMEWEDTRSAGGNILPSTITGAQPSAVDPSADTTQQ